MRNFKNKTNHSAARQLTFDGAAFSRPIRNYVYTHVAINPIFHANRKARGKFARTFPLECTKINKTRRGLARSSDNFHAHHEHLSWRLRVFALRRTRSFYFAFPDSNQLCKTIFSPNVARRDKTNERGKLVQLQAIDLSIVWLSPSTCHLRQLIESSSMVVVSCNLDGEF